MFHSGKSLLKKTILCDGNSAAVLQKPGGFPAEMGKAEIDGAMSGPDPADFLDGLTLDEQFVEEVQIFSNATRNLYTYPCDPVFGFLIYKILKTHTSPLNLVKV